MATEVFAWGYTGWMTQRPSGFLLSAYIDGNEFEIIADTAQQAERPFIRAARCAWLRRKIRISRGLPARDREPASSADTYHEVSLKVVVVAVIKGLTTRLLG
jgi:hypothetical protein